MVASDSVLKRYALAYIKKSGGNDNIQEFLQCCDTQNTENWSEENFKNAYGEFSRPNSNDSLNFLDYLLLQFCIDSLFGGRGHIKVKVSGAKNTTNVYADSQGRKENKKESEDSRKLLALGIVVAVVCVAFHAGMCFWYNSSRKTARKEEKIDYLDNKLKMLRNIEFAVGAVSLAALVACAVYPVLPAWSLVILGINSLACFAGGLAFHMEHEKESKNIEEAKKAVISYRVGCYAPPPYSPSSAPSSPCSEFDNPNTGQQCEGYGRS